VFDCGADHDGGSGNGSVPSRLTLLTWYVCWFQTLRVLTHLSFGDFSALRPTLFDPLCVPHGQT
jgi:hypothetical protein